MTSCGISGRRDRRRYSSRHPYRTLLKSHARSARPSPLILWAPDLVGSLDQLDKCLLHHILGGLLIAEHAIRKRRQVVSRGVIDRPEGRFRPGPDPCDMTVEGVRNRFGQTGDPHPPTSGVRW